jgi:hypothetical protein
MHTVIRDDRPAATAAAVVGSLAITLLATACGTRTAGQVHSARARAGAVTVHLTGRGRFAPAPAWSKPALTPSQAWARYVKVNTSYHGSAIPRGVSVQLGLLTLPIGRTGPHGAEAYLAHNELVYGYRWHQCPQSQGPPGSTLPPNPCIEWNFLNASTGGQIVQTWQVYR